MLMTSLALIILGSAILANGQEIDVEINKQNENYLIIEKITAEDETISWYQLWDKPIDNKLTINDINVTIPSIPFNFPYSINLSELGITTANYYEVEYYLDQNTDSYYKILSYNTTLFTVNFNNVEVFRGEFLKSGSSVDVTLQKTLKGDTITVDSIPIWIYIILILLIVIIIVLFLKPNKKQSEKTKSETIGGSKELLETKKTVLMSILKDIEKQHRAKKISDDTYHKLKNYYKNEAVVTMKNLEDIKSKIK